jgi:hypothetical protein
LSLLIGGTLAALRQKFHLSACPNLAGHLFEPPVEFKVGLVALSQFCMFTEPAAAGVTAPGLVAVALPSEIPAYFDLASKACRAGIRVSTTLGFRDDALTASSLE